MSAPSARTAHAAFARIRPADRDRIRAAFRADWGNRRRRAVIVVGSGVSAIVAVVVARATVGEGGTALGLFAAAVLGVFATLMLWLHRQRMFQGFAGSGLDAAERAAVLHMLRTDPAYTDERDGDP